MRPPFSTFALATLVACSRATQVVSAEPEGFKLPSDFATKSAEYMRERARVTGFSGAVLIAHRGQPILREAYGLANHELEVPNTPLMRFRIGSITKQFTAEQLSLIVLSNIWSSGDRSQVRTIANELSAMAFGEPYELPRERKQTKLDAQSLEALAGLYTGKDSFAIAREGERLMLQFPPGKSVLELLPESPTLLFAKGREHFFTFAKDDRGRVTHVIVSNEGEVGRWVKSQ